MRPTLNTNRQPAQLLNFNQRHMIREIQEERFRIDLSPENIAERDKNSKTVGDISDINCNRLGEVIGACFPTSPSKLFKPEYSAETEDRDVAALQDKRQLPIASGSALVGLLRNVGSITLNSTENHNQKAEANLTKLFGPEMAIAKTGQATTDGGTIEDCKTESAQSELLTNKYNLEIDKSTTGELLPDFNVNLFNPQKIVPQSHTKTPIHLYFSNQDSNLYHAQYNRSKSIIINIEYFHNSKMKIQISNNNFSIKYYSNDKSFSEFTLSRIRNLLNEINSFDEKFSTEYSVLYQHRSTGKSFSNQPEFSGRRRYSQRETQNNEVLKVETFAKPAESILPRMSDSSNLYW